MPLQLQLRRGTSTQNDAFTGAVGEITVDTTNRTIRVHDNSTAGGSALVSVSSTQTLTNKTLTSPTIGGHATIEGQLLTGVTGTGNLVLSASPTFTGHITLEGATLTGKTGTGNLVLASSPSLSAPTITTSLTYGGITLSNAVTGTGNMVLSAAPALTGTTTAVNLTVSGTLRVGAVEIKSLAIAMATALS
jgi:hypothetical protein